MPKLILWGASILAVVLVLVLLNTARQAARLTIITETPAERADRLAVHWRLLLPEGPGPHPGVILLSGCDGVRDNMAFWADEFVRQGRAALIVDSHAPRRLDDFEAWRLVCAGQAMTGAERAADVAVALQALGSMGEVDDDVVIFGASHGGWTAMEFVGLVASGDVPPGLSGWPAPPDALMDTVSAVVLLYPYCGVLNAAASDRWDAAVPTLMILAENDSIVSTPACLSRADALRRGGAPIETLVLPGADHGFDQRERSWLSTLAFDVVLRDRAREAVFGFLARDGAQDRP